ncbi:hypothetical protein H4Q26_005000 [Puccinia striiformis f. sp. tritici PST-130]|uniref:Uncharacterized protein n=1 Tax=Puccinia striiformis f. sp. tritici PST-78 TaxID=1165861 RepID=A0A0L0US48_9BASI|nr:hypothetical protein Pst134EB_008030 [Puccinia striiformis f. sp. tritici]KAI9608811.1 hypothetical protein H4Q26_005000 [Puccinia striiformis f. sp. tritici PST-130]KNE89917.1 hypothetical protein PSTG_16621 [Puccinia striiformis f. sp. tritici PST-78]
MSTKNTSLIAELRSFISIPTLKGSLAYVLCLVLLFLDPFRGLLEFPAAGSSAILFCIAAFPGKSVGACMLGLILGLAGIVLGTLNFFVLAQLASYPTLQAIVFFLMVYILGRIKALGPHLLAFSLLCILMSWNGIYTSFLTSPRGFSSGYMISYLQSYCWGATIAFAVNILVLPHSAEKEFRLALVDALDHVKTLAYLIDKTYRFVITEDEKLIRDNLVDSIRAELDRLDGKLMEIIPEVSYSKWSLKDYRQMLQLAKSMNRSLVTAHSSLIQINQIRSDTFQENFLLSSWRDMGLLRKQVFIALTEIQKALAMGPMLASLEQKQYEWLEEELAHNTINPPTDLEESCAHGEEAPLFSPQSGSSGFKIDSRRGLSMGHVATEEELSSPIQFVNPADGQRSQHTSDGQLYSSYARAEPKSSTIPPASSNTHIYDPVSELIQIHWQSFQGIQHRRINEIMLFGNFDHRQKEVLRSGISRLSFSGSIKPPSETPSVQSSRQAGSEIDASSIIPCDSLIINRAPSIDSSSDEDRTDDSTLGSMEGTDSIELYRSLIRASSYSLAMKNFHHDLISIRGLAADWNNLDSTRPSRVHVHVFEAFRRTIPAEEDPAVKESTITSDQDVDTCPEVKTTKQALDLLARRQCPQEAISFMRGLSAVDRFFRGSNSIYAFKLSCALTVLATLFLADKTRKFAIDYGLTAAILTAAVGLTPTLGQTWLSFISQLIGQSSGIVYGTIMVKLFSDLGGYRYNPYGLVAALALFSLPMSHILYTKPHLFVISFLALNSAGGLVYIQDINQHQPFDSPGLRMGKSLVCLFIAILVVTCVQMFVLRNPAKHTLRSSVAKLIHRNSTYALLINSFIKSVVTCDPSIRPSSQTISQVNAYLIQLEDQLQKDILALLPLIRFAGIEPSLGRPASTEVEYLNILRANQAILDRNREARIAMGGAPFSELVLTEFAEVLKPQRQRASHRIASNFHICTASLKAKLPLPTIDTHPPSTQQFSRQMLHDAVRLSAHLVQSPGGIAILQDDELTRYWTYILSTSGILVQLDRIRQSCHIILGTIGEGEDLV